MNRTHVNTEVRLRVRSPDGSQQKQITIIDHDYDEAQRLYDLGEVGEVHLQDRRDGCVWVLARAEVVGMRPTQAEPDPAPSTVSALRRSRVARG
jgi:hypothetical protein